MVNNVQRIVEYVPGMNEYPVVCNISTPEGHRQYRYSLTDMSSIDVTTNTFSFAINRLLVSEYDTHKLFYGVISINLDTCEQSSYLRPHGRLNNLTGLEYDSQ